MKRQLVLALGIFAATPAWSSPARPGQSPPPLPSPASATHVVRAGDSLEKIARLHDCKVADLMTANQLKADSIIFPGQKLTLPTPAPQEKAAPTPATAVAAAPATGPSHTVAAGETFASIARQHGIPLSQLLAANPDIKPTALRPGQSVRLGETPAIPSTSPSQETGSTQMILASHSSTPTSESSDKPLASPAVVKIRSIRIDRPMTYLEFASRQGTNTRRLNQLNGLDLLDSALLAGGTELLAPAQP